jgi:integrase
MAVSSKPNGRQEVQFKGLDQKRRTLRVGVMFRADAERIETHVETILEAAAAGVLLDRCDTAECGKLPTALRRKALDTIAWFADVPAKLWAKLVGVGLVSPRDAGEQLSALETVGGSLQAYLNRRTDAKPGTRVFYGHTVRNLCEFFGEGRQLGSVTPAEADDFRRWLQVNEKLSAATVARRCGLAQQFFRDAVRRRLISANPFEGMKRGTNHNPERQRFITAGTIAKVIDACPNAEWRALVALSRFGGLRVPSEAMSLRVGDVELAAGRMVIHSPKTERYEGRDKRLCPVFPELRPFLEELDAQIHAGQVWLFERLRPAACVDGDWRGANLRTQFERIIRRAGVKPWPRLWHNLRASRQTELTDQYPAHVVAAWLGNTERIAQRHYLQVTDAHFERAIHEASEAKSDAQSDARSSVHRTAHACTDNKKPAQNSGCSTIQPVSESRQMGGTGFEPVTSTV